MAGHHAQYLGEKFGCIFAPYFTPETWAVFCKSVEGEISEAQSSAPSPARPSERCPNEGCQSHACQAGGCISVEEAAGILVADRAAATTALLEHDLRLVDVAARKPHDLVAIDQVETLLTDDIGRRYQVLHVAADDLAPWGPDTWPAWTCVNGVYRFTAGERQPRASREQHQANVRLARQRKNDPDGLGYAQPPVVMHVGGSIGESDSTFVYLRRRASSGDWGSCGATELDTSGMLRWWKDKLA